LDAFIKVRSEFIGCEFLPFLVFACLALLRRGKRVCDISGWDHDDAVILGDNDVTRAERRQKRNIH
jgi:hypothetical protein